MKIIHRDPSKTAIILKFFIHKLDASLQITVHGQNVFKWKMKNENQSEPTVPGLIKFCPCQKMNRQLGQNYLLNSPVKEACRSIYHGMTIKLQSSLNLDTSPSDEVVTRPDDPSPQRFQTCNKMCAFFLPDFKIFSSQCVCCYNWPLQAHCCQLCKHFYQEYVKITHWNQIYFSISLGFKNKNKIVKCTDEPLHGMVIMQLQSC